MKTVLIHLEGGIVQAILCDKLPEEEIRFVVMDYDTEGGFSGGNFNRSLSGRLDGRGSCQRTPTTSLRHLYSGHKPGIHRGIK